MKKVTLKSKSVHKGLIQIGVAVAVWTLCLGAVQTRASGDPSQGSSQTWDSLLSGGGERGIAYITFSSDSSMSGIELLAPTPASLAASSTGRGGAGIGRGGETIGRGGETIGRGESGGTGGTNSTSSGGSTNSPSTNNVVLFGSGGIVGSWHFDAKSNIVGSFVRTNAPDTNDAFVSFTGTVSSGTTPHLTLLISAGTNRSTYHGVFALTTNSLKFPDPTTGTGPWSGFKQVNGQKSFEQFTLTLDSIGTLGVYDLIGIGTNLFTGTNYTTIGICLLSSQGRIGFALTETNSISTNSNLRATMGPFSSTATAIHTHTTGIQEDQSGVIFNPTLLK
jgi:hypothetical protein